MRETIIQLLSAMAGSMGFCLLFYVRTHLILPASLGGLLSWGVYLIGITFSDEIFIPSICSAAFSALYAELMARVLKAPATIFFIPAVIPLIPGSTLYYTMSYIVQRDWTATREYAYSTAQYALGIAVGASLVWVLTDMIRRFRLKFSSSNFIQIH